MALEIAGQAERLGGGGGDLARRFDGLLPRDLDVHARTPRGDELEE